jgi:hypothetical protein
VACDYDLSATPFQPDSHDSKRICPECGLLQGLSVQADVDRLARAVLFASWVPWAWALAAACVLGALSVADLIAPFIGGTLFWIGVAGFAGLMIFLATRALRVAWVDARPSDRVANVLFTIPILIVGHVCMATIAVIVFGVLFVLFAPMF